jgi:hypothetical protein
MLRSANDDHPHGLANGSGLGHHARGGNGAGYGGGGYYEGGGRQLGALFHNGRKVNRRGAPQPEKRLKNL